MFTNNLDFKVEMGRRKWKKYTDGPRKPAEPLHGMFSNDISKCLTLRMCSNLPQRTRAETQRLNYVLWCFSK